MTRYRDRADDCVYLGASLLNLNQPEQALQEARHAIRMEPRYATDVTPKRFKLGRRGATSAATVRKPTANPSSPKNGTAPAGQRKPVAIGHCPNLVHSRDRPDVCGGCRAVASAPSVEVSECGVVAMLEIFKPTFQGPVQIGDNDWQALPVSAPGLGPEHVDESDNPFDELASETRDQEIRF